MTAPELKPCPFCGAQAERIDIGNDECGNAGGSVIQCAKCMASSRVEFGFKENLIDAWERRADLAAVQPAQVRVKPLVWEHEARNGWKFGVAWATGYHIIIIRRDDGWHYVNGAGGAFPFIEAAKAAAQADYEARILAALETQPDPRDEVIARLVEALEEIADLTDDLVNGIYTPDSFTSQPARAAIAAAKAVQHG